MALSRAPSPSAERVASSSPWCAVSVSPSLRAHLRAQHRRAGDVSAQRAGHGSSGRNQPDGAHAGSAEGVHALSLTAEAQPGLSAQHRWIWTCCRSSHNTVAVACERACDACPQLVAVAPSTARYGLRARCAMKSLQTRDPASQAIELWPHQLRGCEASLQA